MKGKPHEHQTSTDDFHAKVQQIHGPVAETFLRAHLVMMHGASAPITDQVWDGLVVTHRQLHQEVPVSTPQMPFPHTHTAEGEDIITFHAERTTTSVQRHLITQHGVDAATMTPPQVRQRHAEIHAVLMGAEQQAQLTERDKRTYAAGVLRSLAANRLGELDHTHLPWQGEGISIVATDEVQSQLYGWAIRLENGEDL